MGVMYFFPTDPDVSDFSKGRIKPLIANNPVIAQQMADTDEVGIKKVGKSFIYLRGMRSKSGLKSVPADMIVIDEKDEADPESCAMAEKRLSASSFKWKLKLSNPTIPNYGIDVEFQESDQNYWQLKCPHCGHWNCVEDSFPNCLMKTQQGVILGCMKCKGELDKNNGAWVTKKPDNKEIRGYHYSQLFSPTITAGELLKEYHTAVNQGQLGIFTNLTLGYPYLETKDKLSVEQVYALCDPEYPKEIFKMPGPMFIGIDQGKDLHIVFKKIIEGKFYTWAVVERDFSETHKYINGCTRCVIDALPETREARKLAMKYPGKVYLNYYNANQKGSYKWDDEQQIVQVNRTESMDTSHSFFVPGRNVLPMRNKSVEEYAEQCSNTARILEEDKTTGSRRYIWKKLGADHYRHADNYACIAMMPFIENSTPMPYEEPYEQEQSI